MEGKPAVFARNYLEYLEESAEACREDPQRLITFRSSLIWRSAAIYVSEYQAIPIYFAVIDDEPVIKFSAHLISVQLDPEYGDPETEKALNSSLPSAESEGLWEDYDSPVRSLYVVKSCHKIDDPFPMTDLIKLNDNAPIDAGFRYSYALVYERGTEPDSSELLPWEIESPEIYWEGATRETSVVTYERSRSAREACLEHHGYSCQACGFNFEQFYGDLGKKYIHVHHRIPLNTVDGEYRIDPVNDLVPLCPNCHSMIHKNEPPLEVKRLIELIQNNAV